MSKPDYVDFQSCIAPLAYLITFRTYGTWLHGEERGAIDRRNYNRYGTPDMAPNERVLSEEKLALKTAPVLLDSAQRDLVELAVREVCEYRSYFLHAVNARTNHVHAVVTANSKPERVMDSFKSYATRRLRKANLITIDRKPWARHGSTKYLWTEEAVASAIDYVLHGQGDEPSC